MKPIEAKEIIIVAQSNISLMLRRSKDEEINRLGKETIGRLEKLLKHMKNNHVDFEES